jgi:AraC-like DNA-binding protein
MFGNFKGAMVSKIGVALYVAPGGGRASHSNRPLHGFVINDETAVRDYIFADGRVMRTGENELFYLPKGSTYYVKAYSDGGCYAINFDTVNEINCEPFCIKFRNNESVLKSFKIAEREWRAQSEVMNIAAKKAVYDIIMGLYGEDRRSYMPDGRFLMLAPAVEMIRTEFCQNELTVARLAEACNVSEAYFRRLFETKFGVSPKEYIIEKRLGYAKQLLESGEVSVSDAALLCGYSETTHFSREFTRRVGVSPSEYKRGLSVY